MPDKNLLSFGRVLRGLPILEMIHMNGKDNVQVDKVGLQKIPKSPIIISDVNLFD